jgi:hypothetical protein
MHLGATGNDNISDVPKANNGSAEENLIVQKRVRKEGEGEFRFRGK